MRPTGGLALDVLRRALALELGHIAIEEDVDRLATPELYIREVRYMVRGLSRDDVIRVLAHESLLVRQFVSTTPPQVADQVFAELDDLARRR